MTALERWTASEDGLERDPDGAWVKYEDVRESTDYAEECRRLLRDARSVLDYWRKLQTSVTSERVREVLIPAIDAALATTRTEIVRPQVVTQAPGVSHAHDSIVRGGEAASEGVKGPQPIPEYAVNRLVACPNAAHMGEHACTNKAQCWEPCGELGKSAEDVQPAAPEVEEAVERSLAYPRLRRKLRDIENGMRSGNRHKAADALAEAAALIERLCGESSQGIVRPAFIEELREHLMQFIENLSDEYKDSPNALGALGRTMKYIRTLEINPVPAQGTGK